MRTLHLVSHTHWDREWYLTFQQFRLKLVQMLDSLLDLLEKEPEFKHFMLDGQTIVLDDYLEIRPERESQIRHLVSSGRLLVGPWHVLPDEFLVSPEAIIRNLLEGQSRSHDFGDSMPVGYIPDPFGHIGQMPQILRGFGLESACLQRGVADEPLEFWWQAPDGSRVVVAYLRDGYANAVGLPASLPRIFASEIQRRRDSLMPNSPSGQHLLLMHGNDHWTADQDVGKAISYTNEHPELIDGDLLLHSTLPEYMEAVKAGARDWITLNGELRSSRRHNLLPGVLSTRMWIKQRNHACQNLLEKWVEPFSTFAEIAGSASPGSERLSKFAPIVRKTWRYLMECHPHDSICGCSIDQVHEEMQSRFDQVEQIAEELTQQSLTAISEMVNTSLPPCLVESQVFAAVIAFNPLTQPSTGEVSAQLELPHGLEGFQILDEVGNIVPYHLIDRQVHELLDLTLDRHAFKNLYRQMQVGRVNGLLTNSISVRRQAKHVFVEAVMSESGPVEKGSRAFQKPEIEAMLDDPSIETYRLKARSPQLVKVSFLAREVPGIGYCTFWIRKHSDQFITTVQTQAANDKTIENEHLVVQASAKDGTFTLTHKLTGTKIEGLNHFVDGGDRGDSYNFSPPPMDNYVRVGKVSSVNIIRDPARQIIEINQIMQVPRSLMRDRQARSNEMVDMTITTRAVLTRDVPRLDFQTQVDNVALDHRLRVHFPLPFRPETALCDGHFEIVERTLDLPPFDRTWPEQPRPEMPQRLFTAVSGQGLQLLLANRGLPEVQVIQLPSVGELALTLLRCTGWLSRDDFPERTGPAGPILPTPAAQVPGLHTFDYSIIVSESGDLNAYHQAYAFNAPMRAAQVALHPGVLKEQASFLKVEPSEFVISAIKTTKDGTCMLVRGYNISSNTINVQLKPWRPFSSILKTSLSEKGGDRLEQEEGGAIQVPVRGHEIVTLKFCQQD